MSRRTVRGPATALVLACVVAWAGSDATAWAQQPAYGVSLVSQVLLTPSWTLRGNLGGVFAGNLETGAVGITARGGVVTGGTSLVRTLRRGQFGGELTGAWSPNVSLAGSALGAQLGGNVSLSSRVTLDGGLGAGWFAGSPAWSVQLGMSADLR